MLSTYTYTKLPYAAAPELRDGAVRRYPVVIVGAGPVGMAAAIDLKQQGVPVLLLDDGDTVSVGSRGLCYAKRTLEILDRLGCGEPVVEKGVTWNVGRTFFREREVFNFNLLPEPDHKRPGMVNLQQYYLEEFMVARVLELGIDARWKSRVTQVTPQETHVVLQVETPDGSYAVEADWLIVADGARSPIRTMLGLDVQGHVFQDRFLIADVVMKADYPPERRFWFDPPFHPNQSVLLHREADNVWRIDFQLGRDVDPEEEKKPEKVIPRIRAMLGDDREFELEWVSVYTFQCRCMHEFRHGRCLFAGDAAHQVSPFGARGANSGVQDADNLVWKLKLVMDGKAPHTLLDTYTEERRAAAEENILNSTRSTDFISPQSPVSRVFRNAVLELAQQHAFARKLVNSGRLSVPAYLLDSRLNTPDDEAFEGRMVPGAPIDDAPLEAVGRPAWLTDMLGNRFTLLYFCADAGAIPSQTLSLFKQLADAPIPIDVVVLAGRAHELAGARVLCDAGGVAANRYDARDGTCYLVRPDQHVAARWRAPDSQRLRAALQRATGNA